MRLIECYIENFGTLHDFRYSFNDGLNVLNQDNGFGKTTLSVFIKAMLYGLDDTKKTKLEENDRRHYMPWQGGVFGGWLTFTTGTLSYKVERTFGAKASEDTYTLYELETGKVSLAYQKGLGEKIFGIDADGFERTVFLSERRLSQKSDNKSVSAKLSDLVGCDFDLGELDNALSVLEDRRKYYYKKGGSGKIGDIKTEIAGVDSEIARISRIADTIPEREQKLSEFQTKISEKQTLLSEYSYRTTKAQSEIAYTKKKNALDELEKEISESLSFFENGVPSENEVIDAERAYSEAESIRATLDDASADDRKRADIHSEISKADVIIDRFERENGNGSKSKAHIFIFLLAAVLGAVGAILSFGIALGVGIALLVCAAVACVLGAVLYSKHASSVSAADTLYSEAKIFLDRFGRSYVQRENYQREIYEIKANLNTELALLNQKSKTSMERKARLEALERRYSTFLLRFKTVTDSPFIEIRDRISDHKRLSWRYEDTKKEVADFIRANGIDPDKIDTANGDAYDILSVNPETLKADLNEMNRNKTLFEREYRDALDEVGRIDEYIAKKEELTEALHTAEGKYKTINLTRDHLNKAKERLTTKYLGKTRDAFSEYISLMSGEAPELFTLSVDFGITRSIGSVSKPEEAYSLGTREMYSLAARLALCDSLYDVDRPFIILDDPFVHLDDKRYLAAAKVLKRIAADRQIIYLTCSKSRAI